MLIAALPRQTARQPQSACELNNNKKVFAAPARLRNGVFLCAVNAK
jgi:hypothetical protein